MGDWCKKAKQETCQSSVIPDLHKEASAQVDVVYPNGEAYSPLRIGKCKVLCLLGLKDNHILRMLWHPTQICPEECCSFKIDVLSFSHPLELLCAVTCYMLVTTEIAATNGSRIVRWERSWTQMQAKRKITGNPSLVLVATAVVFRWCGQWTAWCLLMSGREWCS